MNFLYSDFLFFGTFINQMISNYPTFNFIGANPNKTASFGKTCLGEAANLGNVDIAKLLIDASAPASHSSTVAPHSVISRKRLTKSHKRKYRYDGPAETVVKCKNKNDKKFIEYYSMGHNENVTLKQDNRLDRNQGYFVMIHSEGSSSDESKVSSLKASLSPPSLTPSPQSDLEWDEEIDNQAPIADTSEDESWTSMYK